MECFDIDSVQFGILSDDDITKMSVCELTSTKLVGPNSVYDQRMGILEMDEICPTCNQNSKNCIGHFGHINLNVPVLHPLYHRLILNILKCICYKCSKLLLSGDKLQVSNLFKTSATNRFYTIVKNMDKVDICTNCEIPQPKYIFSTSEKQIYMIFKMNGDVTRIQINEQEIYKIFSNISQEDIYLLGLNRNNFHPKNLVIHLLPVLPPVSRPYVMADGITCDDDLTLQYLEIIKANTHIGNLKLSEFKKQKFIQILKFRIRSLFDNSSEKQKVSNGRPLKGIKKRLTGKEGLIRNNLMGKRVDKSARSVIGPDPTLKIDEIGIPYEIANILAYPVIVNDNNKKEIETWIEEEKVNFILRRKVDQDFCRINMKYASNNFHTKLLYGDIIFRNGEYYTTVKKEIEKYSLQENDVIFRNGKKLEHVQGATKKNFEIHPGDIVERRIRDGDILLLNRQPTLHRGSMIAQKVKLLPGKTIRLNLAITTSFNADFDGDEMNLFCPNNVDSETELRYLSSVDNFILNAQSSKANIVLVQDTLLGVYRMTLPSQPKLSKQEMFKIIYSIGNFGYNQFCHKKEYFDSLDSGKFLFSILLPNDFFYHKRNDLDSNEPTVIIEHGILKSGVLHKKIVNDLVGLLYLEYDSQIAKEFINNVQFVATNYLLVTGFTVGIKDCILNDRENIESSVSKSLVKARSIHEGIKNEKIKEIYTNFSLGATRDLGLSIAKNSMDSNNNFISTVQSGAKGQFFNIAQITGLLGQQQVTGGRIPYVLSNNSRSLPHYPLNIEQYSDDELYESRGFIRSCFAHGLNPKEYYLHSMTGREGITDTAMKTATSGYIQRRMIKVSEDTTICYDGTVRNSNNNIVQFAYGNNYLNPSYTMIRKGKPCPFDVGRLIERENYNLEQDYLKSKT
jgi:DNA-directed RNA polymerase beta' subunit